MIILDLFDLNFWTENDGKEVLYCDYDTYQWAFYVRVADPNHKWNPMTLTPMMCRNGNEYGYRTTNPFKSEGMRRLFEEARRKALQRRKDLIVQYVTM